MTKPFQFLFIFATIIHHSTAFSSCGPDRLDISSNSTSGPMNTTEYQQNIKVVLDKLPTNKTSIYLYRWVNAHFGIDPNAAYAQARCIGYVNNKTCEDSIQRAIADLKENHCPEATTTTLYTGDCIAKISDQNVSTDMDSFIINKNISTVERSKKAAFNAARDWLFDKLGENAKSRTDGYQMFATGRWYEQTSKKMIYGATQCSSNLNSSECGTCLDKVNKVFEEGFDGVIGGSIVGLSCNFQYEVYPFISDQRLFVDFSPPMSPPSPSTGERASIALPAIYILSALVIISII